MLPCLRLILVAPFSLLAVGCVVHSRPETPREIREEHREERHEERHEEKREEKREEHRDHEHP